MDTLSTSCRHRNEPFRLVADRLPLLVWMSGSDKRRTYFNRAWLDFTGRALECEVGDGWAEGVHVEDLQHCLDTYSRAFDAREPFIVEYRLRRNDGEYRSVVDHAAPLFDPDGAFAGYIGTCVDVTGFRRAEAERNLANDRLRLAMESGKSVSWDWDLETDRQSWFGDLWTLFAIPSNVFVGTIDDFRRYVHPDDRMGVQQTIDDALKNRSPYAAEFRVLRADGTLRWVAAKGQFYYSSAGEPKRMLGINWDITERKNVEESLRRKQMELKEAQRLAGVGSWHWDQASGTVTWSEELFRLAARDPSLPAVTYEQHPQLYSVESWNRLRAAVETSLQTGAPYELLLEMICADGSHRWVTARGEVDRGSTGNITGLRGTVQDITERKRAEEALSNVNGRLLAAQEAERARIARDLHDDIGQRLALLAVTMAPLKELLSDSSPDVARLSLETSQKHLAEIASDVQALSHQLHPPNLVYVGLESAVRSFCGGLADQGVQIDLHFEDVPTSVSPDVSVCLFRILQEALHNAVRHSRSEHFEVRLRATGDTLELTVRDEGVGFDVEATRGFGLGLTSMRERLKIVGGELFIESQSSRGTTIHARTPIRGGEDVAEGVPRVRTTYSPGDWRF
jgi:PAS domain S-box-containing protein